MSVVEFAHEICGITGTCRGLLVASRCCAMDACGGGIASIQLRNRWASSCRLDLFFARPVSDSTGEDPINFVEKINRRLQLHRQLINRSAERALEVFLDCLPSSDDA